MIYLLWAAVWVVLAAFGAVVIGGVIHLADARAPRAEAPEYEAAA